MSKKFLENLRFTQFLLSKGDAYETCYSYILLTNNPRNFLPYDDTNFLFFRFWNSGLEFIKDKRP